MKKITTYLFAVTILCASVSTAWSQSETWEINSLEKINGHNVEVIGNPSVATTDSGQAMQFDGVDDQIFVESGNPLGDAEAFTVEVLFKPETVEDISAEPRFLHLQDPSNDNRRLLIEIRYNDNNEWYPDVFLKSDSDDLALIDDNFTYPLDEWAHIAAVFTDGTLKAYVNGELLMEGAVSYDQIPDGAKVSLGGRMNKVNYLKGFIKKVKFSQEALDPEFFF